MAMRPAGSVGQTPGVRCCNGPPGMGQRSLDRTDLPRSRHDRDPYRRVASQLFGSGSPAAVSPVTRDGAEDYPGHELPDPELRANEELRCVLEIMTLFSADYISGDEDGILGLKKTLGQLRSSDWFTELGSKIEEKLNYLEDSLDAFGEQLGAEVRAAQEALAARACDNNRRCSLESGVDSWRCSGRAEVPSAQPTVPRRLGSITSPRIKGFV